MARRLHPQDGQILSDRKRYDAQYARARLIVELNCGGRRAVDDMVTCNNIARIVENKSAARGDATAI